MIPTTIQIIKRVKYLLFYILDIYLMYFEFLDLLNGIQVNSVSLPTQGPHLH